MNPRYVWPAVVTALGGMAGLGIMAYLHIDKDTIYWIGTLLLLPLITVLVMGQNASQNAETKAAVQQVQQTATQVQQQTNGNNTRLLDILEAQGKLLAQMQPSATPSPEPVPPSTVEVPPQ